MCLMKSAFFFLVKIQKNTEKKTDVRDQLSLPFIIWIPLPLTRLITIYLKSSSPLGSHKITLASFFSELSNPFSYSPLSSPSPLGNGIFWDFCPQHSFSGSCSLWVSSPTSMVSAITKCLSSVQTEPQSSRCTHAVLHC